MASPIGSQGNKNNGSSSTRQLEQFAAKLRAMSEYEFLNFQEEFLNFHLPRGGKALFQERLEVARQNAVRQSSQWSDARVAFTDVADRDSSGARLAEFILLYPGTNIFPSVHEFEKLSKSLADEVLKNWDELRHLFVNFEHTICMRWTQLTNDKRKQLLLDVWPRIALSHRPEPDVVVDNAEAFERNPFLGFAHWNSDVCMVPQINLEDLVSSEVLPVYLESRAKRHPRAFASTELLHAPLTVWKESVLWQRLDGYSTSFNSHSTLAPYVSVTKWPNQSDARRITSTQSSYHPATGVQILNIQRTIYTFLLGCCRTILNGCVTDSISTRSPLPARLEPHSVAQFPQMTTTSELFMLSPYSSPAQFNFSRMRSLVHATTTELEDHIWTLREDPEYFADTFKRHSEHRPERLRDAKGQLHPMLRKPRRSCWGLSFVMWSWILTISYISGMSLIAL
jgi:hypothetical protein